MKIACYPFAACADMEENLRHIRLGVKTAAEHRARLVCFQECALTGYPPVETAIENITEEKCAAGIQAVSALAREWGICILIGTVLYDGGRRYNSALVFDENGKKSAAMTNGPCGAGTWKTSPRGSGTACSPWTA